MNKIADKIKIADLLSQTLQIPDYQRPYTWREKQVLQLLDDIKDARDANRIYYLLGSVILFQTANEQDKEQFEIVDGQQRLTTITLLLYCLGEKDIPLLKQKYSHSESQQNLHKNHQTIQAWLDKKEIDNVAFLTFILEKVYFVKILAPSQDEAFVFFDSQNSRGKALEIYDLLKAHHLRYITNKNELVAKECTIFWEKIDKTQQLGFLIYTVLCRTRAWSRKEYANMDILKEFQSQRVSNNSYGFYKLNNYHQPPVFESWRYIDREEHDDDDGLELVFRDVDTWMGNKRLKFVSDSKKFLPFQINQPLEGGEQFFWFIEKYHQLYHHLFVNESNELPHLFIKLHQTLKSLSYNLGLNYILQVFEAACLYYFDKFGAEGVVEFAVCLEHQISILRFEKASVQYASIAKFIRLGDNVFSIINEAAFPEHIIRKLMQKTEGRYNRMDKVNIDGGFRATYFAALYGTDGFYTRHKNELRDFAIMESKMKFQTKLKQ